MQHLEMVLSITFMILYMSGRKTFNAANNKETVNMIGEINEKFTADT